MGLSTNATYLDARKGQLLLDSGLDFLVISLDGATADTYARMRVGGNFAATVENVRGFLRLRRRRRMQGRMRVVVQLVVTDENRHEIEPFAAAWAGEAHVMIKEARDWAGQVPLRLGKARPAGRNGPCRMLWTELTVLWDGAVVPCANVFEHENVLGDLNTQTLDEVWNGAAMRALRSAHLRDAVDGVPVCATCPRQPFLHADFIAVDQLTQRLRNYVRTDLAPRPGLS
jgi:radical SAM protein with 4Fe4S-binding SPASM domain